jgi:hypothetical protein
MTVPKLFINMSISTIVPELNYAGAHPKGCRVAPRVSKNDKNRVAAEHQCPDLPRSFIV